MICPKCGFEQPESVDCARCGIIFSRYKGAAPARPETPPVFATPPPAWAPPPPVPAEVFGGPPPPPLAADGGYDPGFEPAPAAGAYHAASFEPAPTAGVSYPASFEPVPTAGTLYQGPPPAAVPPRPGTMYGGPLNTGVGSRNHVRTVDFSAGPILGQTFSIFLRNIVPFGIISMVVVLPITFAIYYFFANNLLAELPPDARKLNLEAAVSGMSLVMAAVVSAPFATAALTYGVFQEMRKREGTILDCLRVGLSSVLPVLGVVIAQIGVIILAMIACVLAGIVLVMVLPPMLGGIGVAALVLGVLAYLFVVFAVSVPAAVEERPGIFEALRRSAYLTAGHRRSVLGVLFVLGLLNQGVGYLLEKAFSDPLSRDYLTAVAGTQLVLTGLSATAAAVMYYKLRGADESVAVEDIVSVFD